ncbi:MAG: 2-C-methyl-D-erythritol 4-phosphate cytidylyltransferase [Oscillospiraceae bacterium]|nr:2-C-methyl-D-erythritol 4-phosphate cytidylyltransferase [Oscillospiraceae bacterium]
MLYIAAIMAGGVSSRMGKSKPKQFLDLNGRPVLIVTLDKFINAFDAVYVGIHPEWCEYTAGLLCDFYGKDHNIKIVQGGKSRHDTLMEVIAKIEKNHILSEEDVIVTHDAARPLVSKEIIAAHIREMKNQICCGTYIENEDTLAYSENRKTIKKTISRHNIWRAQTPQSFKLSALKNAIKNLSREQIESLTDACGIFELAHKHTPVKIVPGSMLNFKITKQEDLELAGKLILISF